MICCNECGAELFEPPEGYTSIIYEVVKRGFVFKNPILFTNISQDLVFCDNHCSKYYFQKNIPSNPQITEALNEVKKGIPQASKEIAEKMHKLVNTLNKLKKKQ